jgi:nitrogen regulatory protein PII
MAFLVVLVLDDTDKRSLILDAWESVGVKGITILGSTGLGRVRRAGLRDDLPLMPSLQDMLYGETSHHHTLFSVVDSQEQVNALIKTTQTIIGDLSQPNTGLLFVVPVLQVVGLPKTETWQENDQRQGEN